MEGPAVRPGALLTPLSERKRALSPVQSAPGGLRKAPLTGRPHHLPPTLQEPPNASPVAGSPCPPRPAELSCFKHQSRPRSGPTAQGSLPMRHPQPGNLLGPRPGHQSRSDVRRRWEADVCHLPVGPRPQEGTGFTAPHPNPLGAQESCVGSDTSP